MIAVDVFPGYLSICEKGSQMEPRENYELKGSWEPRGNCQSSP